MISSDEIWVIGCILMFIFLGIIGSFVITLLINLNSTVKMVNDIIKKNKSNIDTTLKDMPLLYDNLVEISESAKGKMKEVEGLIENVYETSEVANLTISSIKSDIVDKTKNIVDIVHLLLKLLFYNDKKK